MYVCLQRLSISGRCWPVDRRVHSPDETDAAQVDVGQGGGAMPAAEHEGEGEQGGAVRRHRPGNGNFDIMWTIA